MSMHKHVMSAYIQISLLDKNKLNRAFTCSKNYVTSTPYVTAKLKKDYFCDGRNRNVTHLQSAPEVVN